jgi:hypothetical protein
VAARTPLANAPSTVAAIVRVAVASPAQNSAPVSAAANRARAPVPPGRKKVQPPGDQPFRKDKAG